MSRTRGTGIPTTPVPATRPSATHPTAEDADDVVSVGKPNADRPLAPDPGRNVLQQAARSAPITPGVYLFLDDQDEILYIGKAINLRQRLRQHAAAPRSRSWLDQKYTRVRRVVWEPAVDDRQASWREEELIFTFSPPHNGIPERDRPTGPMHRAPYIVVEPGPAESELRFQLLDGRPTGTQAKAYGCFPHLGKGMGAALGIARSDGYTALLRLLWAASPAGSHVPSGLTRSAPPDVTLSVDGSLRSELHRFLSGQRPRLIGDLLDRADNRPAYLLPALRRDAAAATLFFAAGPQRLRATRLRHGVPSGPVDLDSYLRLIAAEITPLIVE